MYVFVRLDLSKVQRLVQASHACLEIGRQFIPDSMEHPHLVVIGIKNENKLKKIAEEINDNFAISEFYESWSGKPELTAFATRPVLDEQRDLFQRFCILKE